MFHELVDDLDQIGLPHISLTYVSYEGCKTFIPTTHEDVLTGKFIKYVKLLPELNCTYK